jgi:hypothetical protein
MSIDLYSNKFFIQKLQYIHPNPYQPKWNLAQSPFGYKYSSTFTMRHAKMNLIFYTLCRYLTTVGQGTNVNGEQPKLRTAFVYFIISLRMAEGLALPVE